MAEEKAIILTKEGLEALKAELENLRVVRRIEIAEKINEARMQGDLSENAEYDAAKEEQAEIEARISTIEKTLRNVEVIETDELRNDYVSLGNTVKVYDEEFEEEIEYMIVGSTEADPTQGRLSNESPLGVALMGHAVGDVVESEAPDGILKFKILEIK
ncbi:MAG: transcription elongation factor GreA [Firmicutes bacterium]|nr:transcription elongation factor GreA [Bacillota bacterium]